MEALIGVIGTLVGTILGWILNILSENKGKIIINVDQISVEVQKGEMIEKNICLDLSLSILNNKKVRSGINNCDIIIETYTGKQVSFLRKILRYKDDVNELEKALNIESNALQKVYVHQTLSLLFSQIDIQREHKIYLEYTVNGKRTPKKLLIYSKKDEKPTVTE